VVWWRLVVLGGLTTDLAHRRQMALRQCLDRVPLVVVELLSGRFGRLA
jgi:hypothetical protein